MSKITLTKSPRIPDELLQELLDIYSPMLEKIAEKLYSPDDYAKELPLATRRELAKRATDSHEWKLKIGGDGSRFNVTVFGNGFAMERKFFPEQKVMVHEFLELKGKLQGRGIANIVAQASLRAADYLGVELASVHANLDVGGYTWIRKGAVPHGGAMELLNVAWGEGQLKGAGELKKRLRNILEPMSEAERRAFLLSDKFREFKKLFINTEWKGSFDLVDEKVRLAMVGKAPRIEAVGTTFTANQKILDSYVRHQTHLLRYAQGLTNDQLPSLAKTERSLHDEIVRWVSKAEGNRNLIGARGRKWQADFEKAIASVRGPAWEKVREEVVSQLQELATVEAGTGAAIIESAVPVTLGMATPPASNLLAIVNSQPFQGRTLKQWLERSEFGDVERITRAAKVGVIQGQTPTQVARSIIGTRRMRYRDGVARKAFKDLESVILTVSNGIQNEVKAAVYAENADIVQFEQFVNTLDSRTTMVCIGAGEGDPHGKGAGVYRRGEGPIPPLHFRCRSIRVPFLDPQAVVNRPSDSSTQKQLLREYAEEAKIDGVANRGELPRGHKTSFDKFARKRKRELVGPVPSQTTYAEFLANQTEEFQAEVLGATRARLFREGKVSLERFTARDGDVLTLDELRRKGIELD